MPTGGLSDSWFDNEHPALRKCWHPVAWASELLDGQILPIELLGERWCIARLGDRVAALRDECPHRLAPLSAGTVVGGTVQCGYHGYRFDADGRCVEIPAVDPSLPIPRNAACQSAARVAEHLGIIWMALEEPLVPLPVVPEHDDPAFVRCPLPAMDWRASAAQMADNFLDQGHFAFLHVDTFADPDDKIVGDYEVVRDGWTYSVSYWHLTKALADSYEPGEDFRSNQRESYFVFTPPHHVYLRINYPAENSILPISFCHQPVNATTTRLFCTDYRNDIPDTEEMRAETAKFQLAVALEDRAMLERTWRKGVPLDVTAELHTKADRITLEMRRVLGELVLAATDEHGAR